MTATVPVTSFLPQASDFDWDATAGCFRHRYDRDLQLVVIWPLARPHEDRILELIAERFRVTACFEVHWSEERRENNFERLYATGVGLGSGKVDDAGVGPLLLVIVEDLDPVYQYRRNVSGHLELTNVHIASVKRAARDLAGGYSVHSSNGISEFFRDGTLLLGPRLLDEVLHRVPSDVVPERQQLHADLVGAHGWTSLDELVEVLRRTVEYVVLRNFDSLPASLEHDSEIDALARDQLDFAAIVNGAPQDPRSGAAFLTSIGGREVVFDVRFIGDGYLDARWEESLLHRRVVPLDTVSRPRIDDHFFSLLYHAKVQKEVVKPQYVTLLTALAIELHQPTEVAQDVTEDDVAARVLDGFLSGNCYVLPRPLDSCTYRNAEFVEKLRMTKIDADDAQLLRRQVWSSARHSRVGSWAAESDRLRAMMRWLRRRLHGRPEEQEAG